MTSQKERIIALWAAKRDRQTEDALHLIGAMIDHEMHCPTCCDIPPRRMYCQRMWELYKLTIEKALYVQKWTTMVEKGQNF